VRVRVCVRVRVRVRVREVRGLVGERLPEVRR